VAGKIKASYDKTIRPIAPLHGLVRSVAWKGGDLAVAALSRLRRFELPHDRLLPTYKLSMLLGTYEPETVRLFKRTILPGMVVIDIGAHVGFYTRLFARLAGPQGRVFAFEPHPANFELLTKNIRRKNFGNVTLVPKAVGDRDGEAAFYDTGLSMGHSLLSVKPHSGQFSVKTTSLDTFARETNLRDADLIKIDVEGGELEVLQGMKILAEQSAGLTVVLEFKPEIQSWRRSHSGELLDTLGSMGFEVSAIGKQGELVPLNPASNGKAAGLLEKCNLFAKK
jgi:FkbM family methyltransferase